MMKLISICFFFAVLFSCHKGEKVDLIIHNAIIYSANDKNEVSEAIAIREGKIIDIGVERYILNKYRADEYLDAETKSIYPGFHFGNSHFLENAKKPEGIDLAHCTSRQQILNCILREKQLSQKKSFMGENTKFSLINLPRLIFEIDSIFPEMKIVLIGENEMLRFPNASGLESFDAEKMTSSFDVTNIEEVKDKILDFQMTCFQYGITSIDEQNVEVQDLSTLDALYAAKKLKLEINVFIKSNLENLNYCKSNGIKIKNKLALQGINGFQFSRFLNDFISTEFQLSIPSSAFINEKSNDSIFRVLQAVYKAKPDHRWRVTEAEKLTNVNLLKLKSLGVLLQFNEIPTSENIKNIATNDGVFAVLSNSTLNFWDPFNTFLTLQDINSDSEVNLKSLTSYPSFLGRSNRKYGTLEIGKWANLIITKIPLTEMSDENTNYAISTFIRGKSVFTMK